MPTKSDASVEARPSIDKVDKIVAPFPIIMEAEVIHGFGRGSKELGIPTANYPQEYVDTASLTTLETGIYYGYSMVNPKGLGEGKTEPKDESNDLLPMVMSLGWNPFYKNEKRSAEVHVIHKFKKDFYGQTMKTIVLGYIRPERNYDSLEDLVADINFDIEFAKKSLQRPNYSKEAISNLL
ncbi:riboflavin kinase [Entomophthora muscae]|uniref:Riboflavin kinase n=1 Tax=Entomophthora muscae TaxID=34485 RepID=A0ACC2UQ43_9FUNG|nr:riboflavin kinase [Entomophthora muscae]